MLCANGYCTDRVLLLKIGESAIWIGATIFSFSPGLLSVQSTEYMHICLTHHSSPLPPACSYIASLSLLRQFPGCLARPLGHLSLGKNISFVCFLEAVLKDHQESSGVIPQGALWRLGMKVPHTPFLVILSTVLTHFRQKAFGGSTEGCKLLLHPKLAWLW